MANKTNLRMQLGRATVVQRLRRSPCDRAVQDRPLTGARFFFSLQHAWQKAGRLIIQ